MKWISKICVLAIVLTGVMASVLYFRNSIPTPSDWMTTQIEKDVAPFAKAKLSQKQVRQIAEDPANDHHFLVHYTIKNNKVSTFHRLAPDHPLGQEHLIPRMNAITNALKQIVKKYPLPDMEFLVTLHDVFYESFEIPIFVMAKTLQMGNQILFPDFQALRGEYQVLKGQDITKDSAIPAWDGRKGQLVWRGGPSQHPPLGFPVSLDPHEPHCLSRIKLCYLSQRNPELIDARFSYLGESWPSLGQFLGSFITFEDQMTYKYQAQIDGYSCAYTSSGWKFFTGALVFKEDSHHIQWYYQALKPYVHYIPVKEGLGDLLDKLEWARLHDEEARLIAQQGREFALSHITQEQNRLYYYHALLAYSRLNWTD